MKFSFNPKGFTLIELMIVIVILGILVGTILPRITGGQDRARSVATIADVNTIAQALEIYYNDYGYYPNITEGSSSLCLTPASSVATALAPYLKGGAIPQPSASTSTLSCVGSYYYYEFDPTLAAPNYHTDATPPHYVVAGDVPTWQMANYPVYFVGLPATEFQSIIQLVVGGSSGNDRDIVGLTLANINRISDRIGALAQENQDSSITVPLGSLYVVTTF